MTIHPDDDMAHNVLEEQRADAARDAMHDMEQAQQKVEEMLSEFGLERSDFGPTEEYRRRLRAHEADERARAWAKHKVERMRDDPDVKVPDVDPRYLDSGVDGCPTREEFDSEVLDRFIEFHRRSFAQPVPLPEPPQTSVIEREASGATLRIELDMSDFRM